MLFYAFLVVDQTSFQFNDCKCYSIHIDHNVGTLVLAKKWVYVTNLFCNRKMIVLWMVEIEKHYVFMLLLW